MNWDLVPKKVLIMYRNRRKNVIAMRYGNFMDKTAREIVQDFSSLCPIKLFYFLFDDEVK